MKRTKKSSGAWGRHNVERLEARELLSTLLEGVAANNLAGTTVTPLGNIFDDSTAGLVGDDFAIAAPGAGNSAGHVYVVFGGPHLNPTPATQQGCINPPTRVQACSLIDTFLTNRVALRILGARQGDLAGFSVAGVGNAIGDSRPDVLVGAPFALNSAGDSTGKAYLIGGEYIASVISTARTTGGTAVATIDLATPDATATLRTFTGLGPGDQAGNSVAGLGQGHFIVGAPMNGAAPKQERGAAYVFKSLRGSTGPGTLTPFAIVLGPSFHAHLGGVPVADFTGTGYRGYGVSGIRSPALIPVADELPNDNRYDVIGGFEPDVLVGAPDACVFDACTMTDADPSTPALDPEQRNGRAYLLSGTGPITLGGTFDLSVDADLKTLSAIPVQGVANGDRLGTAVSGAGDLDGDGVSDFMFSAPNRDIPGTIPATSISNAGEVYVVFGREVNSIPFPDGQCQEDPGSVSHQNFRQCRDSAGLVVPLNVADFLVAGKVVGLNLRGEVANERVGISLAEAGNFNDPVGRLAAVQPSEVGVSDIMIGAPFRDIIAPGQFLPAAGRAYVPFGSRDYQTVSGQARSLALIDDTQLGLVLDGREANGNYGISVASAGDAFHPVGQDGDDILIGANHIDVTLGGVVAADVGETELILGSIGGAAGGELPISPLPFIQPGPYGPQVLAGGFWSWTNLAPVGGAVVHFPLQPSQPQSGNLFPPGTTVHVPPGSIGPFVPALPYAGILYIPDKPLALVDRGGNLNVYGGPVSSSGGANVTATLKSPKLKPGVAVVASGNNSASIFAVDQSGHLIHHSLGSEGWYAADLTTAAGGPTLSGSVSVQQIGNTSSPNFIVSGRTVSGEMVIYGGNESTGWGTVNLSQLGGGSATPSGVAAPGRGASAATTLNVNYAINSSGHLIEYRPSKRRWLTSDITAAANGPAVQGDVSVNMFIGGAARATLEVFARGTDGHLIRYYRAGKLGWRTEDISAQSSGGAAAALTGSIVTVSGGFGQRFVYAQAGGRIVEFSSDIDGWHAQELALPTGVSSIVGPLAATATNGGTGRVLYGYAPNGALVQFTSDGTTWTASVLNSTSGSSAGTSPLGTLFDSLADLGTMSR